MNVPSIAAKLLALLTEIAPDVDPATVDPHQAFRDQFDFDSMDALHFAAAVGKEFKLEIADTDYPALTSLETAARFVEARLAPKS